MQKYMHSTFPLTHGTGQDDDRVYFGQVEAEKNHAQPNLSQFAVVLFFSW